MTRNLYLFTSLVFVIGIMLGYSATYITFQNTIQQLQIENDSKTSDISDLQDIIVNLQLEIEDLQKIIENITSESYAPIIIRVSRWCMECKYVIIGIENVGNTTVFIESISLRRNTHGSIFYSDPNTESMINVGDSVDLSWHEMLSAPSGFLKINSSYVIRATLSDGSFSEIISQSPSI
jgi:hypothetical protein